MLTSSLRTTSWPSKVVVFVNIDDVFTSSSTTTLVSFFSIQQLFLAAAAEVSANSISSVLPATPPREGCERVATNEALSQLGPTVDDDGLDEVVIVGGGLKGLPVAEIGAEGAVAEMDCEGDRVC